MPAQSNMQRNTESYAQKRAQDGAMQQTSQGMQKATLFFCVFTSGLLTVFAWLMTEISHSPWGLLGAAIIVMTLTVQQSMRKPVTAALVNASDLSRGAA